VSGTRRTEPATGRVMGVWIDPPTARGTTRRPGRSTAGRGAGSGRRRPAATELRLTCPVRITGPLHGGLGRDGDGAAAVPAPRLHRGIPACHVTGRAVPMCNDLKGHRGLPVVLAGTVSGGSSRPHGVAGVSVRGSSCIQCTSPNRAVPLGTHRSYRNALIVVRDRAHPRSRARSSFSPSVGPTDGSRSDHRTGAGYSPGRSRRPEQAGVLPGVARQEQRV
jgi:hypothetical protein